MDDVIPFTGDAKPFMREWLESMGLRGAMKVSNVPLFQEWLAPSAWYGCARPFSTLAMATNRPVTT